MPKIGEKLRLRLQLFDFADDKYPKAFLYDENGGSLGSVNLDLVEDGLYQNNDFSMPDTELVTAIFKVYSDSGRTTLNEDYLPSIVNFGKTERTLSVLDLEAEIESNELDGEVLTQELDAVISDVEIVTC